MEEDFREKRDRGFFNPFVDECRLKRCLAISAMVFVAFTIFFTIFGVVTDLVPNNTLNIAQVFDYIFGGMGLGVLFTLVVFVSTSNFYRRKYLKAQVKVVAPVSRFD